MDRKLAKVMPFLEFSLLKAMGEIHPHQPKICYTANRVVKIEKVKK